MVNTLWSTNLDQNFVMGGFQRRLETECTAGWRPAGGHGGGRQASGIATHSSATIALLFSVCSAATAPVIEMRILE
jgi:hypothetical protein